MCVYILVWETITREAGNAHSSGTPGSTPFASSAKLYWVFTGLIFIFYSCCSLSIDLWHRISILDLSADTLIICVELE